MAELALLNRTLPPRAFDLSFWLQHMFDKNEKSASHLQIIKANNKSAPQLLTFGPRRDVWQVHYHSVLLVKQPPCTLEAVKCRLLLLLLVKK